MSGLVVAPSLLSGDFARLGEEVASLERQGADWVHLDVMDGHFVPNITFGPQVVRALRPLTKLPFDVHLMIAPADPYLAAFAQAGADHMLIHAEAGPHLHRSLQEVRKLGCRPGVAINPATPVEHAMSVLDLVDSVLVMTVNPGFGGQAFIESSLDKLAAMRRAIDASGRSIRLQVDGGITPETAPRVVAAGADTLVAGTAVFGHADRAAAIAALRAGGPAMMAPGPIVSGVERWLRGARRQMARLPSLRLRGVPDAPALPVRDPWSGDPGRGAGLLKGELIFAGSTARLLPANQSQGGFRLAAASEEMRAHAHGFVWLRDLRALGTDAARMRARALVADWIAAPAADPIGRARGRVRQPHRRLARPL